MKTERLASPCEHSSGAVRRVDFINSKRVRILSFAEMQIKIDCYMVFRKIFGGREEENIFRKSFRAKNDSPPKSFAPVCLYV